MIPKPEELINEREKIWFFDSLEKIQVAECMRE